jgi:hypothetical protein
VVDLFPCVGVVHRVTTCVWWWGVGFKYFVVWLRATHCLLCVGKFSAG